VVPEKKSREKYNLQKIICVLLNCYKYKHQNIIEVPSLNSEAQASNTNIRSIHKIKNKFSIRKQQLRKAAWVRFTHGQPNYGLCDHKEAALTQNVRLGRNNAKGSIMAPRHAGMSISTPP
jgi:hypothetical protein